MKLSLNNSVHGNLLQAKAIVRCRGHRPDLGVVDERWWDRHVAIWNGEQKGCWQRRDNDDVKGGEDAHKVGEVRSTTNSMETSVPSIEAGSPCCHPKRLTEDPT